MELTEDNGKAQTTRPHFSETGRHVPTAVHIVPGVQGPREVEFDWIPDDWMPGGAVAVSLKCEYYEAQARYVCTEFRAYRSPDAPEGKGYVTSEVLRETTLATWIATALNTGEPVTWEFPKPP